MNVEKLKPFPLRDVLTVTTGRLLTVRKGERDNGIGDLYELLNWMTGDSLYTHQLGRASDVCRPYLLSLYPELANANDALSLLDSALATRDPYDAIERWLAQLKMIAPEIKDFYDVPPVPEGWTTIDPLIELESMVGKERIITVNVPADKGIQT